MMEGLKSTRENLKIRKMLVICVLTAVIVIPLISASAMLNHPINKGSVQGLQGTTNGVVANLNNESNGIVENFISYVNETEWGAKYFLVTAITQTANKILLSTSKAFMALGGVSGTDRVLTLAKFRETLRKKEIKFKNTVDTFIILKDFSEMKSPLNLHIMIY